MRQDSLTWLIGLWSPFFGGLVVYLIGSRYMLAILRMFAIIESNHLSRDNSGPSVFTTKKHIVVIPLISACLSLLPFF